MNANIRQNDEGFPLPSQGYLGAISLNFLAAGLDE
jgi:hypothetical protein